MNSFVKKGLYCALFVGGLSVLGVGAANAAETSGESGVASGSQVAPDLTAPIVIDGNAISLLGDSSSADATADAAPSSTADGTTSDAAPATTDGTDGTASGTQVAPDLDAPVTLDGNAISLLGDTATNGSSEGTTGDTTSDTASDTAPATTDGTDGTASGTQVAPDLDAPITLDGNAISLLGDTANSGSSEGTTGDTTSDTAPATTDGTDGTASGTQVAPDLDAPVTLDGNAISLLGDTATNGSTSEVPATPGTDGVLAGPVLAGPVLADGIATDGEAVTDGTAVVSGSALPLIRSLRAFASPLGLDAALAVNGDSTITPDGTPLIGVDGDAVIGTEGTAGVDVTIGTGTVVVPGNGDAGSGTDGATDPATGTDPVNNGTGAGVTVDSEAVIEPSPSDGTSEGAVVVSAVANAAGTVPALAVTNASWTEPALTGSAVTIVPAAWLAGTGTSISPLIALVGLFPLMGLALLLIARRKASRI